MKKLLCLLAIVSMVLAGCAKLSTGSLTHKKLPMPPLPEGAKAKSNSSVRRTVDVISRTTEPTYLPTDFALSVRVEKKTNVVLSWINGTPPFQPQLKFDVLSPWINYGPSTALRQITNPVPPSTKAFFRVQGSTATTPGLFQWTRQGTSVNFQTTARSVATDPSGNVVSAGSFQGTVDFGSGLLSSAGKDNFVVKYNSQGALVWVKRFGGVLDDFLQGVAIDSVDNIIVVGTFAGTADFDTDAAVVGDTLTSVAGTSGPSADIFVAKYSPSGRLLWVKAFGGTQADSGSAVSVDGSGNVFMAATFISATIAFGGTILTNGAGGGNFAVAKLSGANGSAAWAKGWGGSSVSTPSALAVGLAWDLWITGSFGGTTELGGGPRTSIGSSDIFIAKYSAANGAHLLSKTVGTATLATEGGNGIAVDPSTGNVIVTGTYGGAADFGCPITDFGGNLNTVGGVFLVTYDAAGNCIWARTPNVAADPASDEAGYAVSVDPAGTIYFTGKVAAPVFFIQYLSGGRDCFVASVTSSGSPRWAKRSGGASGVGLGIAVDTVGHVLMAGRVSSGTMNFDRLLGPAGGSVATGIFTIAPFVAQFSK